MKKLLILFVAAGLLAACNNDKKETDKNKSSVTNREKDDYRSNDSKSTGTTDAEESKPPATDESKTRVTTTGKEDWGNSENTGGWSASDAKRFMNDCERTARKNVSAARAKQYCDCMLQKLVAMFPTYADADRELAGNAKDKLAGMVDECNNP